MYQAVMSKGSLENGFWVGLAALDQEAVSKCTAVVSGLLD